MRGLNDASHQFSVQSFISMNSLALVCLLETKVKSQRTGAVLIILMLVMVVSGFFGMKPKLEYKGSVNLINSLQCASFGAEYFLLFNCYAIYTWNTPTSREPLWKDLQYLILGSY